MRRVSMLVKPASSACDMGCAYCFYRDLAQGRESGRARVMDPKVMGSLIDRALAVGPDASVAFDFQGGEPTLAGLDFFEAFVAEVEARRTRQDVSYAIQTNGLTLDDDWCAFLARHRFLVGVSLDGTRQLHDRLRPATDGSATYARVRGTIERLRDHAIEPAILCVLSCDLARHPQRVHRALVELGCRYVQFIPCLGPVGQATGEMGRHSLTAERFSSFYRGFLDQWERGCAQGHPMSVGLFDDVMELSLGIRPRSCGVVGSCAPQFVVEADGSVYPCDFHAQDRWLMGNVLDQSLQEMARGEVLSDFLQQPRELPGACGPCRFRSMCHGGCRRLSSAFCQGEVCGYREFLEYGYERLALRARAVTGGGPWA